MGLFSLSFFLLISIAFGSSFTSSNLIVYHPNHPKNTQFLNDKHVDIKYQDPVYSISLLVGINPWSIPKTVIFDTGSTFTWVQDDWCTRCLPSRLEYYNPIKRKFNFPVMSCANLNCNKLDIPSASCTSGDECGYGTLYADGTFSHGKVVSDFFYQVGVSPFTFGLGFDNYCGTRSWFCLQGISGFGSSKYSIPRQLNATKWGLCLPLTEETTGRIMFNESASIPGPNNTTPLFDWLGSYYAATISKISVVGVLTKFILWPVNGYLLIDTGTHYTVLTNELFDHLSNSIQQSIFIDFQAKSIPSNSPDFPLCFEQPFALDVTIHLDNVSFHITGESAWIDDSFWVITSRFCLAVARRNSHINILGNRHMAGYMIVHDLSQSTIEPTLPLTGDSARVCLNPAN